MESSQQTPGYKEEEGAFRIDGKLNYSLGDNEVKISLVHFEASVATFKQMQQQRTTHIIICVATNFTPVVSTFVKETSKQCYKIDQDLGRKTPTVVSVIS